VKGRSYILTETHSDTLPMPVPAGIDSPRWYAIQTRSRFEKIVGAELALKGIDHYLATFEALHQWKDRKKVVELPLFSGYVFARFQDADAGRLLVLRTTGVVRILGPSGGIEPIPDVEIDSIRQLLLSGKPSFAHPFLREGSWVRVRKGVLAGVEGRLTRVKNQTRLVLSVDLLSQSVATEVDAWEVEPAPEPRLRERR
jgi:transcription antitermination factor NusG